LPKTCPSLRWLRGLWKCIKNWWAVKADTGNANVLAAKKMVRLCGAIEKCGYFGRKLEVL
ncbi:MAG: hypothetical protein LBH03_06730, partial [Holophagales bacterium]|nr:hypothetical protein [Holophagales bacterium]